jgi:hypothetical protein
VFAAAQRLQHPARIGGVGGLAENLTIAFGDRIASENEAAFDLFRDVGRFLIGQPRD